MIPKTRWAKTIDDAYIAYQDFGEGPVTLVVIHGWITHLEVLWEQRRSARFMQRLARGMRILHLDSAARACRTVSRGPRAWSSDG